MFLLQLIARHVRAKSGRPEEFHLQSPTESDINLSIHPAPVSPSLKTFQS